MSESSLLIGGKRKGDKGALVLPMIFLNPGKDSTVYEEIFNSVLSVLTFETGEETVILANDTLFESLLCISFCAADMILVGWDRPG